MRAVLSVKKGELRKELSKGEKEREEKPVDLEGNNKTVGCGGSQISRGEEDGKE